MLELFQHFFPSHYKHDVQTKVVRGKRRQAFQRDISVLFLDDFTFRLQFESPLQAERLLFECDFLDKDNDTQDNPQDLLIPADSILDNTYSVLQMRRYPASIEVVIGRGTSFFMTTPLVYLR